MNGNSTNSCANSESLQNSQPTGPAHPSLAGADRRIDAFWLLKLHTGQFGWLNLQPVYTILLGGLTIVVTVSGMTMLLRPARMKGS